MAKRSRSTDNSSEIEQIEVRLKPIFGVRPTVYVPFLWGIALLLAFFFLLVYPGIRSYGSRVTVVSVPQGAEITVDGRRVGASPTVFFVEAGPRVISASLPHHAKVERRVEVRGRRFASLLFPRRLDLSFALTDFAGERVLDEGATEFGSWSTSGGPSSQFQFPPSANEAARYLVADLSDLTDGAVSRDYLGRYIAAFAPHVSSHQSSDFIAGAQRLAAAGGVFGPGAIASLVHETIQYESNSPGSHRILRVFDAVVEGHAWYRDQDERLSTAILATSLGLDEGQPIGPQLIEIGRFQFARVPAGEYVVGYPARDEDVTGRPVQFASERWIQREEVTVEQYAEFLRDVPRWGPENRTALIEEGLVSDDYLREWPTDGAETLRYVSYPAASAFAAWVNGESGYAPPEGYRVALPTADEWEYAAFLNDGAWRDGREAASTIGALGIPIMSGGVWEWTDTWYAIHGRFVDVPVGDQRVVIGGASINEDAAYSLRGAQPPDWATPFLGFRLILRPISE